MSMPLRRAAAILLSLLLLAGCGIQSEPETRFYVINAETSAAPLGVDPSLVVEITALNLPQYLERPQIVTRPTSQRLEIDEFHRWGGNLRKNLLRAMARNLTHLLGTQNVQVVPHLARSRVDYRVHINIAQFEPLGGEKVILLADWTVVAVRDNAPAAMRQVRLERPLAGTDMEATVAVMQGLYAELAAGIARAVHEARGR